MPFYVSDSDDQLQSARLFGRERPLHAILGGGKVADVVLWKDKKLSAIVLIVFTIIWFLFEVAEYHFVTLLSYILILTMLAIFISSNAPRMIDWSPPNIRDIRPSESTFKYFFSKVNLLFLNFYEISSGKDLTHFLVVIACLWLLSVIGNYVSSLNLLYMVYLCMQALPVFYERYEKEVEYLATKGNRDARRLYKKFDTNVLTKIPRGPVKERKFK